MLSNLLVDIRSALRHLRHARGFAAAAVLTLAFGIGANTAMLTMLNALLFRPLDIKDPNGLIGVSGRNDRGQSRLTLIPAVGDLAREGPLLDVCGYNGGGVLAFEANKVATQAVVALVTGQCFKTLGVAPILGRTIVDEDAPLMAAGNRVAVIGHQLWTRLFANDPSAIGKTITTEGIELTVIGVMARGFVGLQADFGAEVFAPFDTILPARKDRRPGAAQILGRLRPGVSFEQATAELEARWPALLETATPLTLSPAERDDFRNVRPRVERMGKGVSFLRERYQSPLSIVFGLTSCLLLLACVNLGGLLLARLTERGAELAVRLALGGSRWRIAQQMTIESLLLSLTGTALAIPVSFVLIGPLVSFIPPGLVDRTIPFAPDANVLIATAVIGFVVGVLMSALPTWFAMRRQSSIGFVWNRTIAGATTRWARGLLVVQVALSVVMTIGAGLLTRSVYLLQRADLGVRTEGVLSVRAMPVPNGYRDLDIQSYYASQLEKMVALPGVRSAGFSRLFPRVMADDSSGTPVTLIGSEPGQARGFLETASPGFFETVGIPLVAGRLTTWLDNGRARQVALVNERLARMLVPNGDVLERRIRYGADRNHQDIVIVGIVGNATVGNPRITDLPVIYRPVLQMGPDFRGFPNFALAVNGEPASVAAGVRQILKDGGREYAHSTMPLADVFATAPASERMSATVAGAVAGLAVVLALIGIHGSLAYAISRRTREIGVRVAVGAAPSKVARMIVREGLTVTLIGLAIGLPAAFFAARTLQSLTFGVSTADPLTFIAVAIFFVAIGVAAGVVPARRAASVDPVVALRSE